VTFIPAKITILLIALICTFFSLINLLGYIQLKGLENDYRVIFYHVLGIFSPSLFVYTAFRKDEVIVLVAYYVHSYYALFITFFFIGAIIALLIIDYKILSDYGFAVGIQGIFILLVLWFNYVFYCFQEHYNDLFDNNEGNQISDTSNTAYSNL